MVTGVVWSGTDLGAEGAAALAGSLTKLVQLTTLDVSCTYGGAGMGCECEPVHKRGDAACGQSTILAWREQQHWQSRWAYSYS